MPHRRSARLSTPHTALCCLSLLAAAALACGGSVQRAPCADGGSAESCAPDAGLDSAPPESPKACEIAADGSASGPDCIACRSREECPDRLPFCQAGFCVACPPAESCGRECCSPEEWLRQFYGSQCAPAINGLTSQARQAQLCNPRNPYTVQTRAALLRGLGAGRIGIAEPTCSTDLSLLFSCSRPRLVGLQWVGEPCRNRLECATEFCDQPATCTEGVCAPKPCSSDGECQAGEACRAGQCRTLKTGDRCSAVKQCPADHACIERCPGSTCGELRCTPEVARGESCGAARCRDGLYCDPASQRCEPYQAVGEDCTSRQCGEGLRCDPATQRCAEPPTDGEACADSRAYRCARGHSCIAGVCRAWGAAGAACGNADTPICAARLRCENQTCRRVVFENDACGVDTVCAPGTACRAGRCVAGPFLGEACQPGEVCVQSVCIAARCQRAPPFCGAGTYGAAGTCRPYQALGESCRVSPADDPRLCGPGLRCDGTPRVCVKDRALLGESCRTLQCAPALTCDPDSLTCVTSCAYRR